MAHLTRPAADEYSTFVADYVGRIMDGEDILEVLAEQLDEVRGRLGRIDEARGEFRYAAGKWSIKEIVGHLSDAERIFAYRALRIARGDATPLPGFDENAYAPEVRADERTLADLTAEWSDVRRATLALFDHLPERAWERRGIASDKPVSVRALAYVVAGHVRHHLQVLEERYLGS
ncbi:MAG: DinB family protein [Gemmatimonadales bacterium]|nr:DinB family protein [Gemmatimonadales bacterium]